MNPLLGLTLATALSFATALECNVDLSLISNSLAQCDAGCDSCSFFLATGEFVSHGTVECLPNVECFVNVTTDEWFGMNYATVNGSLASALTVDTSNAGTKAWLQAEIHAPANRGDFRFEASTSQTPLFHTTFHAENSGVVEIIIHSDGINGWSELFQMDVFASTAEELNIFLGNDTRYAMFDESQLECPKNGKCKWESKGQRYDENVDDMTLVNMLIFPGTEMRVLCDDNLESCDGLVVSCNGTAETCDLQYDSDWQCVGTLNSGGTCLATVTVNTPTTEAPHSGANGWKLWHALVVAIGTVLI